MPLIELHDIHKIYPLGQTKVHAIRGVSLSIEEASFISIVGPSGSGKTTLLNLIGCVDTLSSGQIRIDGHDISGLSDNQLTDLRLFTIGFIFQSFHLIPVLNVIENVEFPLLLMNSLSTKEIRKRALDIIEEAQISEQKNHRPAELSGGQRQRVAIARALVTRPKIVLADEPTANLDSETGKSILSLMKRLNDDHGVTFVFSTHDPDVLKYAKRIIKIRDGRLIENEAK